MIKVLYANPERHDYMHSTLLEGLSARSDIELWCLNEGNYGARATMCFRGDHQAALRRVDDADVVVIGTESKRSDLGLGARTVLGASKTPRQRWVLVDSGDLGSLPPIPISWNRFDAVLKRELYLPSRRARVLVGNLLGRRVRRPVEYQFRSHPLLPFPNVQCNALARPAAVSFKRRGFALPPGVHMRCEPIGVEQRLVQTFNDSPQRSVTCTLAANIEPRRRILSHLAGRASVLVEQVPRDASDPVDLVALGAVSPRRVGDHVHSSAYLAWLNKHRASISFPGAGFDTARFWEILASGSLLISKRISLDLPVPLRDGVEYVGYDSLAELNVAIDFALGDSPEVNAIRRRGYRTAIDSYSSRAIADRFTKFEIRGTERQAGDS